jgi:hypothetical protein
MDTRDYRCEIRQKEGQISGLRAKEVALGIGVGSRLERDRRRLENMAGGSRQGNTGS